MCELKTYPFLFLFLFLLLSFVAKLDDRPTVCEVVRFFSNILFLLLQIRACILYLLGCGTYSNDNFNGPKQPFKIHRKTSTMKAFPANLQAQPCYCSKCISITSIFLFRNFWEQLFIVHV